MYEQQEYYGDTKRITFDPSNTVCELGCGPLSNIWIPQQLTEGHYTGIDISQEQIEAGRTRALEFGLSNVALQIGDATNTNLPEKSFDVLFCRCLLIHLPSPENVINEMVRLVKPGGRIVLVEPHDPSYYVTPNKENLLRVQRARVALGYGTGKGSPDVALNLYSLLSRAGVRDITVSPHIITAIGTEKARCAWFLNNLRRMAEPIVEPAIAQGLITDEQWRLAQEEASTTEDETFIYQSMWIAVGVRQESAA